MVAFSRTFDHINHFVVIFVLGLAVSKDLTGSRLPILTFANGPSSPLVSEEMRQSDAYFWRQESVSAYAENGFADKEFRHPSFYPTWTELHGGQDVQLFATGENILDITYSVYDVNEKFSFLLWKNVL